MQAIANVQVRMSPTLYLKLQAQAKKSGMSLNKLIVALLEQREGVK